MCAGFAQVFPEHKYLIVECLRELHYKVGMTGDGVGYLDTCIQVCVCMYVCMYVCMVPDPNLNYVLNYVRSTMPLL